MSRSNQNQVNTLLEAWELITRFRWQFIIPCFVVCAGVLAASLLLPRKYKAEAIFERRTDLVMEEIASRGASSNYQQPRAGLVQEIAGEPAIDKLLRERAEQLRTTSRQAGHHLDMTALRHDLITKLLIHRDIGTSSLDRVRVSLTTEHPKIAQFVVNALVEDYINQTRSQLDNRLRESQAFFQGEVEQARRRIEALENTRLSFEIEHAGLLPDNPNNIQVALAETQSQYATVCEKRDEARMQVAALQRALDNMSATTPSFVTKQNPQLEQMRAKLSELQSTLAQYTTVFKMTDRHPDLIDLRQQIHDLQAAIAQTPGEIVSEKHFDANPHYAQIQVVLTQASAGADALDKQVASIEQKVEHLNTASVGLFPVRAEYKKMEREIEQAMRHLSFWEGNLNRVNMSLAAEDGNRGVQLNFIRPCGALTMPVSPNLVHVLLAAIGMGLMAGTVSILFAHRTNESFTTGEQLSHAMGIALIGSVSEIISGQQRRMRRLRNYVLYPLNIAGMSAVLLVMVAMLYVNLKRPELYGRMIDNPQATIRAHLSDDTGTSLQD
jgi:uncharacterized protein involved in exopolysaccharide biosynthesis